MLISLQRLQILPPAAWPFSTAESMIWGYEADYHLVRNLYRLAGALKANCVGKPRAPVRSSSYPNNHIGTVRSRTTPRDFSYTTLQKIQPLSPSIKRKAFPSIRLLHFPSLQAKIAGGNY